jgi:hypothetical protein
MEESFDILKQRRFKLSHTIWMKRYFDANSKEDVVAYKYFLENGRWKDRCPFILEWPYLTVTDMIRTQLIESHIDKMIKDGK